MITVFLRAITTGILDGSIYGLLAMGLTLQYGVCQVLNISHGEFLMLGAMLTLTLSRAFGISPLLAVAIIGPILFVIGFLLQITLFRTLKARTPSPPVFEGSALLVTFGLYYVIDYAALMRWTGLTYTHTYLTNRVSFLGTVYGLNQIVACVIAVAIGVAVYLFLSRTRPGRAIRATAEDPATAGLMGVNTSMMLAFCFGLGALLAGIAGVMITWRTPINITIGFNNTVIALVVVVLGGLGSVPGSFIAGILIGIVSQLVAEFWDPLLIVPVYYAILMVLLLVKPVGLLGKR
jgi:branched-chain amino acid transport system permease protein